VREYLTSLLYVQRFIVPSLLALTVWAVWRTVWRKDFGTGLALYVALVIIADGFLNTGLFIPGLDKGSIHYSEVCAAFLLFNRPASSTRGALFGLVCGFVGLYFTLLLLSAFRGASSVAVLFEFRRLIVPQVIALFLAIRGMRSPDDFRRFFLGLMAVSVAAGLFVLFDVLFDRWLIASDTLNSFDYGMNRSNGRFGSFFINPNYLGAFVVLVFPVSFMWALNEKRAWRKLVGAAGLLSLAFCLVETQSRAPLVVFGVVLVLLLLAPSGELSRTRRLGIFLPLAVVFMIVMPGFFERASSRFGSLDEEMNTETRSRQALWVYTERILADYPLAGSGFGELQFRTKVDEYGFGQRYGSTFDNPHNSYLQMTVYAGFPALFAFAAANFLLLMRAIQLSLQGSRARQSYTVFGLAIGIAGFLGTIYPDMHMFTQTVAPIYWVIFGLLLSSLTAVAEAPIRDADARLATERADRARGADSAVPVPLAGALAARAGRAADSGPGYRRPDIINARGLLRSRVDARRGSE
jgi:O-antigen ligase